MGASQFTEKSNLVVQKRLICFQISNLAFLARMLIKQAFLLCLVRTILHQKQCRLPNQACPALLDLQNRNEKDLLNETAEYSEAHETLFLTGQEIFLSHCCNISLMT